jgi:hypothetical protein
MAESSISILKIEWDIAVTLSRLMKWDIKRAASISKQVIEDIEKAAKTKELL